MWSRVAGVVVCGAVLGLVGLPVWAMSTGFEKQTRSDKWITWRVDALLLNDNQFDYRLVQVACKNGEVTLKGSVWTDYERSHATLVASDVPGVKAVQNTILVVEPLNVDFVLMKAVRSEILQDPILNVTALFVDVNEERNPAGTVTLYGIVSTPQQKDRVAEIVRGVPGVKQVVSEIDVEPAKVETLLAPSSGNANLRKGDVP